MPNLPEPVPPFILVEKSAASETRAYLAGLGAVRIEVWQRDPSTPPVTIGPDVLRTLARIAGLPPGGAPMTTARCSGCGRQIAPANTDRHGPRRIALATPAVPHPRRRGLAAGHLQVDGLRADPYRPAAGHVHRPSASRRGGGAGSVPPVAAAWAAVKAGDR